MCACSISRCWKAAKINPPSPPPHEKHTTRPRQHLSLSPSSRARQTMTQANPCINGLLIIRVPERLPWVTPPPGWDSREDEAAR